MAQRLQQGASAVKVGPHAQVKIKFAFARDCRGKVKHAVKVFVMQRQALSLQGAGALCDPWVSEQVWRRTHLVGQHHGLNGLSRQVAASQQGSSQSGA
jgi:hypothetical protein